MGKAAISFLTRPANDFREWLTIGDPKTMARIRECVRRYSRDDARSAIVMACYKPQEQSHER